MEQRIADIDFNALTAGRTFFPSPAAWEDEVLYFLMLDRFSDGREKGYRDNSGAIVTTGTTPPFQPADRGNATATAADRARAGSDAGERFAGGTLRGLERRSATSSAWASPPSGSAPSSSRCPRSETYHGYGIQNFLDVDPHFGTRDDLRVGRAHRPPARHPRHPRHHPQPRRRRLRLPAAATAVRRARPRRQRRAQGSLLAGGRHDLRRRWVTATPPATRRCRSARSPRAHFPDGAIWPAEFQHAGRRSRAKGKIRNWDYDPEFREGDFEDLKDIQPGHGPGRRLPAVGAFLALCQAFKFWIAYADSTASASTPSSTWTPGRAGFFTSVIHEFAQSIGKENFYLIGEITGGRQRAFDTLEITGHGRGPGHRRYPGQARVPGQGIPRTARTTSTCSATRCWSARSRTPGSATRSSRLFDDHDQVRKRRPKSRASRTTRARPAQAGASGGARVTRHHAGHPVHLLRHRAAVRRQRRQRPLHPRGDVRRRVRRLRDRAAVISSTKRGPPIARCRRSWRFDAAIWSCAGDASFSVRSPATARISACRR